MVPVLLHPFTGFLDPSFRCKPTKINKIVVLTPVKIKWPKRESNMETMMIIMMMRKIASSMHRRRLLNPVASSEIASSSGSHLLCRTIYVLTLFVLKLKGLHWHRLLRGGRSWCTQGKLTLLWYKCFDSAQILRFMEPLELVDMREGPAVGRTENQHSRVRSS